MNRIGLVFLITLLGSVLFLGAFMQVRAYGETTDENTAVTETIEAAEGASTSTKAISAAAIVGVVAAVGAIMMGVAIAKSVESMARQPEAAGKINSSMMLGLVFIETAIIYALIVAILIIFVL